MAIRSGFFNSVNGDRKYDAKRFAEYFASFIGNGVFPNPSSNLQVTANNDMTVTVRAGKAWINGYILINDDDYILEIEPTDGVLNRIDRIVARYDVSNREITLEVKQGEFASNAIAKELQRDADVYEIALADIYVGAGVISISQSAITDLRLNTELCGIVHGTVEQVDTTTLFNQYVDWYTTTTGQAETDIEAIKQQFQDNLTQFEQDWNDWFSQQQTEGFVMAVEKGQPNGIATLDENGKVPDEQLPEIEVPSPTIATQAEAETGTNNTKFMTPLRTHQAIDSKVRVVDNNLLELNIAGEIKTYLLTYVAFLDNTNAPGPKYAIAGSWDAGFFGEVSASELITGDDLASLVGISAGTSQFSNEPWLKFAYQGKIQFVAKKPFRYGLSWNGINAANAVYGDRTVTIGGLTYKVRLMRGANKDPAGAYDGSICHGSEWNRLMLPIHENAPNSWAYPNNVDSPTEDWSVNYTDEDLLTHYNYGNGSYSWCQEVAETASRRVFRGGGGVSYSLSYGASFSLSNYGWRPVLELL